MQFSSLKDKSLATDRKERWNQTIKVWDYLCEQGYEPSDFSDGVIKVNYYSFKRIIEHETHNSCSTYECTGYRSNCVWCNGIQIDFTEVKQDKYILCDNWYPLEDWLKLH